MLVIDVELLHGTIRAGSPDDLALTGHDDPGEWPPSPARLFAALVAAGTRDRWRFGDGSELAVLEGAGRPAIHCDGSRDVLDSTIRSRYVVRNHPEKSTAQEYAGRTSDPARPGTRKCPKHPRATYVWPGLDVDGEALLALRHRAARIGYLGCADSPVRVKVGDTLPAHVVETVWTPAEDGHAAVPVPFTGLTQVLDTAFDDFRSRGERPPAGVRRSAYRSERAWYRDPSVTPPVVEADEPIVLWLRFDRPIAGRRVLSVTATLRDAVLDLYPAPPEGVPAVLHGHLDSPGPDGHQQARFLALPRVGDPHADGRIHGGAVWLPAATGALVVEGVRSALLALSRNGLTRPGVFATGVTLYDGKPRPLTANPDRWTRPSRHWSSVFPVVHERWTRRGPTLADAAEWCRHAGLPAPVAMRSRRAPYLAGAVDLHPSEAHRPGRDRRPYSHVELRFADLVAGPVVVGRSRSFGLGLMAPVVGTQPLPEVSDG